MTMIVRRVLAARVVAAALLVGASGCGSDGPTGVAAGAPAGPALHPQRVAASGVDAPVLERQGTLLFDRSVSATIDERGGSLFLPAGGLLVVVPPGALSGPTTLTATALKGELVAYEFGPHGTRFNVPLLMYQDLSVAQAQSAAELSRLVVGYFTDPTQLDHEGKRATVAEFIPTRVGALGATVRFEVSHFSGYVIATGRGSAAGR